MDTIVTVRDSLKAAQDFAARNNKLFVNGEFVDSTSEDIISSINPSTGEKWGDVQAASSVDVNNVAQAAEQCFHKIWSKVSPRERETMLHRFADILEKNGDVICAIDACDSGRLFGAAAQNSDLVKVGAARIETLIDTIRYFAGWPTKIAGQSFPLIPQPGTTSVCSMQTILEPIGVVACVLPWNAPALFMINKVIPALAAGCTTIVKPAEQTPMSALFIASLFREAGFPAGAVNVINGNGPIGADLCQNPLVKKITFTGSTEVGRKISQAASSTFKRLTLELGGKSAFIVMHDADIDAAAIHARVSGYGNAGQFCMCPSRLFVEKSVLSSFVEKLAALANNIVVGDALAPETTMGPVITRQDRDRIDETVSDARAEGAELIFGGEILDQPGHFFQPTLLSVANPESLIAQKEVFGPVLTLIPFDRQNLDWLVTMANDTEFGLAASLWTKDLSVAHRLASQLEAGIITVNTHPGIDPMIPFGGVKNSGTGREFGHEGFASFLETKSLHIMV
ncbi:aldehyde dehydrogenase [Sphingorhabdus sp. EL138]|uniref:aldehyde dehydrogenase family protein n=1 Tax=Sphingorhabdus sp. EL138 TaxID=2073156 RepID=UPI0013A58E15|nr:aldehyde dehydrogenase family protein [Sphingorhabdus sp. EL138]